MDVTIWLKVGDIEKMLIAEGDYWPADHDVGMPESFDCDTLTDGDGADWWRVLNDDTRDRVELLVLAAIAERRAERKIPDEDWS